MAEGFISDDDVQKVREANDIVALIGQYCSVRQRGKDFWCCCPLHDEKTPSLKIDPALQLWHCFGCGEGGDIFGFLMKMEGLNFPDAVQRLADRAHIEIIPKGGRRVSIDQKTRLRDICRETAQFYNKQLRSSHDQNAQAARDYLGGRGFGSEVAKRWMLGFAPGREALVHHLSDMQFSPEEMIDANVATRGNDHRLRDRFFNRVMFPVYDAQGECIAFGGRVISNGEPKYLNSQETPIFHKSQVLYGLDKAKAAMASTGIAVVVEGYTDVIAMHEAGLCNAVATLGTALTAQHIRQLCRHAQNRIVYLFDGDVAGQRAADRALQFIDVTMMPESGNTKVDLCAVTLPDNLDPAEYVEAYGADNLRAMIDQAQPLLTYGIERRLAAYDPDSPEDRSRALVDALSVLAPIKNTSLAKDYAVNMIAPRVRARKEDVLNRLAHLKSAQHFRQKAEDQVLSNEQTQHVDLSSIERNRQRLERELLSLIAQNPLIALPKMDDICQIHWHYKLHEQLFDSIASALSDDPQISAATLISQVDEVYSEGAGILTSGVVQEDKDIDEVIAFLLQELSIGDIEDAIHDLNLQLSDQKNLSKDEIDMTLNSLVALQKDLSARREARKFLDNPMID